ncbi:MAG TPA: glycosyltransferase family 4 protein [Mucilaginibacter sp.]|nr:glycosyltransferase family 4 protein [Mucilaginibacter sp.]
MKKLAIVTTHPIQYYAPVFRLLNERRNISIKVFYTLGETNWQKYDHGFQQAVSWDIPLLDGYDFEWLDNISGTPGSHHFKGINDPEAISRIKKYQPDALLIFGWAYQTHLKVIRYFKGRIPVYFRGDSTLLNDKRGIKSTLRHLFLKWIVYRNIDHAFYVGQNNKAYFQKNGLTDSELSFAPHAVDNERFSKDRSKEVSDLRQSLNIGNNEILILYAGKFEPVKNLPLFLSAFIDLRQKNVHLLLAGNGSEEDKLKSIAQNDKAAANIHFTGFKNQSYMPVLYQAADLFCLPSKSETWGLSVNEAMACGNAVLVSDKVGCAPDLVGAQNGGVFMSGDIQSLTDKLRELTNDKARLTEIGKQSFKIIRDWNFLHIAESIENKLQNEAY